MAHEINTPMQYIGDNLFFVRDAIDGVRKALESYRELGRKVEEGVASPLEARAIARQEQDANLPYVLDNAPAALEQALAGVGRVATIVRSMTEFVRTDAGEKSLEDLNHSLRSTLTVAGYQVGLSADVETRLAEMPKVLCFPGALSQVFLNLLVNAADAIAERFSGSGKRGRILVESRLEAGAAVISVGDDGAGIPEGVKSRIFEPFFTTKPVGKGLGHGLATAWKIVNAHGGKIWFESSVGVGTTFFVRLPVAQPSPSAGSLTAP